jgi:hypothetical protein
MSVSVKISTIEAIALIDELISSGYDVKVTLENEYRAIQQQKDKPYDEWGKRIVEWRNQHLTPAINKIYAFPNGKLYKIFHSSTAWLKTGYEEKFSNMVVRLEQQLETLVEFQVEIERFGETMSITVSNSPGAVVSTGNVVGGIRTYIQTMEAAGQIELAELLSILAQTVDRMAESSEKKDICNKVHVLASEVSKAPDQRNKSIVGSAWTGLKEVSSVAGLANFFATHGNKLFNLLSAIM